MRYRVFFLLFLTSSMFAQLHDMPLPQSSAEYAPYKGIKSCSEYQLTSPDQQPTVNTLSRIWEYDNNGQPITEYSFFLNEEGYEPTLDTISIVWLTYNTKGQLTRKKGAYESEEVLTVFSYNKKGKLVKKETACIDPPTEVFFYDKKGKLIESKITQKFPENDNDGNMKGVADIFTYHNFYKTDAKGKIIDFVSKAVLSDNEELFHMAYSYDETGKLIKKMRLYPDGNLMFDNIFKYDEKGRVISMKINEYGREGQSSSSYYVYVYK